MVAKNAVENGFIKPEVFITSNKNRKKLYENNVYLNNGENFEFEFFNPTKDRIGIEIYINSEKISNQMLILNPAQRTYLDRYIDSNNKFLFETYLVENSDAAKNAIANNGELVIKFYKEKIVNNFNTIIGGYTSTPYYYGNFYNSCNCTYSTNANSTLTTSSLNFSDNISSQIETGRINKGDKSEQKFDNVNFESDMFSFHTVKIKLLPVSQQNINNHDIKLYCTKCGIRKKKDNWIFCPKCGEKFN